MKAFPNIQLVVSDNGTVRAVTQSDNGMDLRDYFAAKAMQGLVIDRSKIEEQKLDWNSDIQLMSEMSYDIADAMMKARKK